MTRRTGSAPAARRSTSRSARRACRARPRSPGRPSRRSQDWRVGKKDLGENVSADWTCRQCQQFNLAADKVCKKCQAQCPPKTAAAVPLGASEFRSGRGSGHFDRQDPKEERNSHNSDDEDDYDEFGRKKKKTLSKADRQKAALERLKNKGAAARRDRSRSR
ncbi:unnamed protein product [Prorocentrum cordatum]|uniref:RanBP2-type domain-containing protein n=1 Tax=Prorocentrum cordatum TaxID=2364126 RepID=A0ABN9RU72_9DINO|nr:unnamed protein product [Polarella glacialis]